MERKNSNDPGNALITVADLNSFKLELLDEIRDILKEKKVSSKKWLKTYEVLKMLRISPGKLVQMRKNKDLPYTPIGGVFYYDEEDVLKLLENNKVGGITYG